VPEVTTVFCQPHLDAALHDVGIVSQYHAVKVPDFFSNAFFQCVSCAWFAAEYTLFKVAPPKEICGGQT